MTDLRKTAERARLILEDVPTDAAALDTTPFTPQAMGPVLGAMLAQIGALAKCIVELAEAGT